MNQNDWFITRAKKLLFSLEYGQEYKDAAEALYQETVGHVFQMIAEDLLNENPTWTRRLDDREDGSRHGHLQKWIRPELAEIYDKAEREELRKKRFKTGGFCQTNCCKELCKRAKFYELPEVRQTDSE